MEIPETPGVYCLWNKITDQIYVGSSKDLNKRIAKHFSSRCQNPHLKSSIKKYGKENFSITWFETEDLFLEEQKLLDYVFNNSIPTFNVAVKAGGGLLGGTKKEHIKLSHKGKSREELRLEAEAGGSPQRVPLFLICTKTGVITQIESSHDGERLGFGHFTHLSSFSKPHCLNRVKNRLVAKSEPEAKNKFEVWLQIPKNSPIILTLPEGVKQSTLCGLAKVHSINFSRMYREVLNPSTQKPWLYTIQSKVNFVWYGTEIKAGDWFRCTATAITPGLEVPGYNKNTAPNI